MIPTVVTAAKSRRLTTLENVRIDLGGMLGAVDDPRVDRFIDQASATAATFCHRTFGRQIYRERIDLGPHWSSEEIVLSASPLNRILSVTRDGMLLDSGQYLGDGSSIVRYEGEHRCCWYGRTMIVEYEAGWLLPGEEVGTTFTGEVPLPADIEKAVIQLIGVAISEAGRDMTVKSDTVEGIGSRQYYVQGASATLPHPAAEAALMQHQALVLV
jgi:hypothetical protein